MKMFILRFSEYFFSSASGIRVVAELERALCAKYCIQSPKVDTIQELHEDGLLPPLDQLLATGAQYD